MCGCARDAGERNGRKYWEAMMMSPANAALRSCLEGRAERTRNTTTDTRFLGHGGDGQPL